MDQLSFINETILKDLQSSIPDDSMRNPIEYAMKDGKRWRPLLYLSLFQTSNLTSERFPPLRTNILYLEYIHTSSLILDDLPIMDNDDYRRDRLTLHKKYDSATAMLSSLQLLLLSQQHHVTMMSELRKIGYFEDEKTFFLFESVIQKEIHSLLGTSGLCKGQYMDLHMDKNDPDSYLRMVHCKTSSLFILAFLFGYIFSRKTLDHLDTVKELGSSFGILYQLLDDLEDYQTDIQKPQQNNILLFYSKEKIIELFHTHYHRVVHHINSLKIGCLELIEIIHVLKRKWLKNKIILYNT